MKKLILIIFTLLLFFPSIIKAEEAPEDFSFAEKSGYVSIDRVGGYCYIPGNNNYLYSLDLYSFVFPFEDFTVAKQEEIADIGLSYIWQNGYPNKSITGYDEEDYAITQMAILRYMMEMGYIGVKNEKYLNCSGTHSSCQGYGPSILETYDSYLNDYDNLGYYYKAYIEELVNDAIEYQENHSRDLSVDTSNNSLKISSDGQYYESELIEVEMSDALEYNVSFTNAPEETMITDENGNEKTNFNIDEKFKIRVPVNGVNSESVRFKVKATMETEKFYVYKTLAETPWVLYLSNKMNIELDDSHVNFVLSTPYKETYETEQELFLNIEPETAVAVPATGLNNPYIILIVGFSLIIIAVITLSIIAKKKKA